jgi:hypothetical protein
VQKLSSFLIRHFFFICKRSDLATKLNFFINRIEEKKKKMPLTPVQEKECLDLLKQSTLLKHCSDANLMPVVRKCERRVFKKGEILLNQGEPSTQMFVIVDGDVIRERVIQNQVHQIDTHKCGTTVGSLHLIREDPVYATAIAHSDQVVTYALRASLLRELLRSNPELSQEVIYSLTREIRNYTKLQRTPLLQQHPKQTPYFAVSVAASVESFYRSALNSMLNARLTGKQASLFPNMHIQLPTRVVYINGFKGIRQVLDQYVPPDASNPVRLGFAVLPGIIMTPASSILEASNAGHSNPEPMHTRWMRGYLPRTGREIIFGLGLNQLSDWCEERVPVSIESPVLKNALGSMAAGIISGYISHVPHNLCTLKLLNPSLTYSQHFSQYVQKSGWISRLPETFSPRSKTSSASFLSCLFPKGVIIRTTQIVGSYIILNGIINALQTK